MATTVLGKVSITPKGTWSDESAYAILDIVTYGGSSYLAKKAVPAGTELDNTEYWMSIANKGDTGNGIASIALISVLGLEKTYRITYTNGGHFDFVVTDGTPVPGDWYQVKVNVDAGLGATLYPVGHKFIVGHTRYGERKLTVVGHDQITSATGKDHTMTLLWDECLENVQFDSTEAFAYCPSGLAVGTYHMSVTGYGQTVTGTYQFTIPAAVPAGGQLRVSGNPYSTAITSLNVIAYTTKGGTTEVWSSANRPAITEGDEGTDLGAWNGALNHIQRVCYGSNNYGQSAIRQFLNSNASAGNVWSPMTNFDRPPSWAATQPGFLNGIDEDFLTVLDTPSVKCSTNNTYEAPDSQWVKNTSYTLTDRIFLASRMEVFGSSDVADGSTMMTYFVGATDDDRIKLMNGSPKDWWLRTPYSHDAGDTRSVDSDGSLNGSIAYGSYGCVPACII